MRNAACFVRGRAVFISFLCMSVVLRAFNILISELELAGKVPSGLIAFLDVVHDGFVIASYALAISFIVFTSLKSGKRAFLHATLFSVVIFADRAFCIVWDIARSNILLGEKRALSDAVLWLLLDTLFFVCTFFSCALISGAHAGKKNGGYIKVILLSSLVLTVLELSSKAVICIQFFLIYNDVTVTEMSQMAGDFLLVIIKYAFVMFAFAVLWYRHFEKITCENKVKSCKNT